MWRKAEPAAPPGSPDGHGSRLIAVRGAAIAVRGAAVAVAANTDDRSTVAAASKSTFLRILVTIPAAFCGSQSPSRSSPRRLKSGAARQELRSQGCVDPRLAGGDAAIDRQRSSAAAGNVGFALLALVLLTQLAGCGRAQLQPAGPIGDAERKILLDSVVIMLAIVVPTIVATLGVAWWYR